MRDLLFLGLMIVAVYYAFKRPYLGVAAWIWIALTAPAKWAFGFSTSLRMNLSIVLVTGLAFIFSKNEGKVRFTGLGMLIILFALATLFSTINTQAFFPQDTWDYWYQFLKILLLYFFVTFVVTKRLHLNTLVWAIVLSISTYAAMESLKFLLSGGSHRIVGRSGIIADRNDLAVAINMCLPLMFYLRAITESKLIKNGLSVLVVLNILSIIGTYSRAGFIGLSMLALAYYLKSNRKIILTIAALIILPLLYANAPDEWKERQSTVATASEQDGSFIGRLWAWKISILIANDHPLVGAGFNSTMMPNVWHHYRNETAYFDFPVKTKPIPPEIIPKAAHSIYFQVLGDHGYLGFFLFMLILFNALILNVKNKKLAQRLNDKKYIIFSNNITLGMVGFGVTGASVSLAYFDLLYAIIALVVATNLNLKAKITAIEGEKQEKH